MTRTLLALLAALMLMLSPASPASAEVEPPPDGTLVVEGSAAALAAETFDRTYTGSSGYRECRIRVKGTDYGNYVVLSYVGIGAYTYGGSSSDVTRLGVTIRSASGGILKSVDTLHAENAMWSVPPPAGSIGDGGQVRMTADNQSRTGTVYDCSAIAYTANF